MARVHGQAGRSAFRQGNRLLLRIIPLLVAAASLAYAFFRTRGLPHSDLDTLIGFVAMGMIPWCVRKTFSLEKAAKRYYGGADGECDVGVVLAGLPNEFHVFHGLGFRAGDVDHVVVGPTGVFIVETKNHAGTITSQGGRLCRNGKRLPQDLVRQANSEAMYVKSRLRPGTPCHVRPVVVFARAQVRIHTAVEGVHVIPLTNLLDVLTKRPASLNRDDVQRYVKQLSESVETVVCWQRPINEQPQLGCVPMGMVLQESAIISPVIFVPQGKRAGRYP